LPTAPSQATAPAERAYASLDDDLASLRSVLSTSFNPIQSQSAASLPLLDGGLAFELGAHDKLAISNTPKSIAMATAERQDNLIDFDISVAPDLNIDLNFAYVEKSSHPPLGPNERKLQRSKKL
jgi:hypothetical protein